MTWPRDPTIRQTRQSRASCVVDDDGFRAWKALRLQQAQTGIQIVVIV
jgi:hypothetical protein